MTTIINLAAGRSFIDVLSVLFNGLAVLSVVLLLAALVEKVLLDAHGPKTELRKTRAFNIIIWPFLFVLAADVLLRAAQILNLLS